MARRPPKFVLGLAGAEAAKLKKFSDAGETQIWWLSDAARNRFFRLFRYNPENPSFAAMPKWIEESGIWQGGSSKSQAKAISK